jgi:hypothetical protein
MSEIRLPDPRDRERVYDEAHSVWRWADSGQACNHEHACSSCGKAVVSVPLSHRTERGFTTASVDACLAEFVQRLNNAGLQTIASCCGHGDGPATVILEDGRELLVFASLADRVERVGVTPWKEPWARRSGMRSEEGREMKALRELHDALKARHYGRMPDEVQAAYDHAQDVLGCGKPWTETQEGK